MNSDNITKKFLQGLVPKSIDACGATCIMLSPNLILTLFIAADTAINGAYADIDIDNVLRTLQQLHQQQKQQQTEQLAQVKEKSYDRREVDDSESRFGSLGAKEVEKLIHKALTYEDDVVPVKKVSRPYFKNRQPNKQKDATAESFDLYTLLQAINNQQDDDDADDRSDEKVFIQQEPERKKKNKETQYSQIYVDQINKLLTDPYVVRQKHVSKKKRLQPSDLLGDSVYSEAVNRADPSELNDYSKVYVILNVDAIQQSNTRNRLTDLVYSLLQSPPARQRDRRERKRDQRYKGFLVNDDFRRGGKGRSSGEVYSPKDISMDYKPKRLRSRDSNAGGRTPIPYIRHRGDIYEKEN